MKLFLASEAKHLDSIDKLKDFVGGSFGSKRIAYIPTAANGEYFGSWKGGGSIRVASSLGAEIDIVELESFGYQDIYSKINKADILWMAGGMTGYLLYWIRRVELDKKISEILKNIIYVGSSAGSMICSKTQNISDKYIGEEEPGASIFPGLGLIDFEIYPHYEEDLYDQINDNWKEGDGKLCLLKNGEAITVVDGKVTILGEERWIEK